MGTPASERWSALFNACMAAGDLIDYTCPVYFDFPEIGDRFILLEIEMDGNWYRKPIAVGLLDTNDPALADTLYILMCDAIDYLMSRGER